MCALDQASRLIPRTTSVETNKRNPLALRLKPGNGSHWQHDVAASTWPLFLVIALAIKLDSPGPVFFRRSVAGQRRKLFNVLEFRSMVADAHDLLLRDPELQKRYCETLEIENDLRITLVGRILRKTSLDELPQLIKVLRRKKSWGGNRSFLWTKANRGRSHSSGPS